MKNVCMFAFATGKESVKSESFKRYYGVAPVKVLAVNPTKAELEAIYGTQLQNDVNYVGEVEVDGKPIKTARIDFIVRTNEEITGINMVSKITFFLRNEYMFNKDKTKVQVIDKYGRTAWPTVAEAKEHKIPQYSNGPAKLDSAYRPMYRGEEDLVKFIRTYLWIDDVDFYNSNTSSWDTHKDPSACEGILDRIADYFKGDFSEVKEVIALQPNNEIKVMFGVKTTPDNKQFQDVFTRHFLRNSAKKHEYLFTKVEEAQNNNAYSSTEFFNGNLKEYSVEPTSFTETAAPATDDLPMSDDPFARL